MHQYLFFYIATPKIYKQNTKTHPLNLHSSNDKIPKVPKYQINAVNLVNCRFKDILLGIIVATIKPTSRITSQKSSLYNKNFLKYAIS